MIGLVNVAIAGLGEIAFSHYRGIINTSKGKLAGVYSYSKDRAVQIARQWKTKPYDSEPERDQPGRINDHKYGRKFE